MYYHHVGRHGIARVNGDASLDLSFDAGSVAGTGNGVKAIHVYPDGRILIAGGFYGAGRNRIARLNSAGALDPTFDPAEGPNADVACLAVQPDEKLVIGGTFTSVAGQPQARLARLNTDGTLDTNFVASANNNVKAIALQPDGKIIVGGWFSQLNGTSSRYLARLNSDGTVDASFVSSVNVPVERLGLQPDGRTLIGGSFHFSSGAPLARVTSAGSWDPTFSVALGPWVQAIRLQDDGRILIGGVFTTVNGVNRPYMSRLYSDGSTDLSFTSATDNLVDVIAIQADGRFVIAGGFGSVEGIARGGLARLYGDDQAATPVIQFNGTAFKSYQSDASILIPVFRSGNTNVAVTVQYGTADIEAQAGVDYYPSSGLLSFAPGEVAKSITVPLLNDGAVVDFERFTIMLTNAVGGVLGALTNATITVLGVNSLIQIATPDLTTHELAGGLRITLTRVVTNLTSTVHCRTVNGTALAGVNFINLAQTVTFNPGQVSNTVTVTLLDNTEPGPDTSFSVQLGDPTNAQIGVRSNISITILENDAAGHPAFGLNGNVNAVTATADGDAILGGNFISINGTQIERVGKVLPDGRLDPSFALGTGLNGAVVAVLVQADGNIVCGGAFTSFDGTSRPRIARLNANGTLDGGFDPGAGPNSTVLALVSAPNGGCYAGGAFTSYAGAARKGVVRINADGSVDANFVPQVPTASSSFNVFCLATQADGRLLVGSDNAFGANTNIVLRFNADGTRDTTFTNSINVSFGSGRVNSLVPLPDGKIIVGGSFLGGGIARLNANGALDTSFTVSGGVSFGTINKLLLLPNGQIIAVGSFFTYAGIPRNNIVRINSNGSVDPSFASGWGADSSIMDVAPVTGSRFAIGGSFRKFGSLPRYYFAILDSSGFLITRVEIESFAASGDLHFGLAIEPGAPFQLLTSSNLTDWQVIYTNLFHQRFQPCFTKSRCESAVFQNRTDSLIPIHKRVAH